MKQFTKQLLFLLIIVAVFVTGALIIKGATPSGKIAINPSLSAKISMVKQENTTSTTNNPVAWWKFDETTAIHDSTLADSSGNGNTGTLSTGDGSTEKSVAGKLGKGLSFDGSNDYVDLGDKDVFSFTDGSGNDKPFTISFWFNSSINTADLITKYEASGAKEYVIQLTSGKIRVSLMTDSTINLIRNTYNTALSLNTWYYCSVTYDGSETPGGIKIYINGNRVNDTLYSAGKYTGMNNGSSAFQIGEVDFDAYFKGFIDDVKVYNKARTADQIRRDYDSGPLPVLHLRMDENTGQYVYDTSGANNGTLGTDANAGSDDPTWTNGQYGNALKFDGVDDYVDAGNNTSLQLTTNFSVTAWVNPSTYSDNLNTKMLGKFVSSGNN